MGGFAAFGSGGFLNVALSNYMKEFRNNALVGELAAPRVPVERQQFQYVVFDRSDMRIDGSMLRAMGTSARSDRMSFSTEPYRCESYADKTSIPYEVEQYGLGLGFSTKQKAVQRMMNKLLLDREIQTANLLLGSTVTNTLALSGTSMWDNYGGASHPIVVVAEMAQLIRQAGVNPTDFIISDPVFVALQNHPDLIERFKYTNPKGSIDIGQMSQAFGINVVRASAISLDPGNNPSWVWGVGAVMLYTQAASDMQDVSAAKTFVWTGSADKPGSAPPMTTDGYGVVEWPDPDLSKKTDWVAAEWYRDVQITAQETIFQLTNVVSAPTYGTIAAPPVGY